jgi:YcxB-like protein
MDITGQGNFGLNTRCLMVKFTLTANEFLEGQRSFGRSLAPTTSRFWYWFQIPLGILLLAEGIVGFASGGNVGLRLFFIVFGAYLVLDWAFLAPRRVKKEFTRYPDLSGDRMFEFREEKLLVQTSHGKSEMAWSRFSRFAETDSLFVRLAPPRFIYSIPKRVFAPGDCDHLRSLLRLKLSCSRL